MVLGGLLERGVLFANISNMSTKNAPRQEHNHEILGSIPPRRCWCCVWCCVWCCSLVLVLGLGFVLVHAVVVVVVAGWCGASCFCSCWWCEKAVSKKQAWGPIRRQVGDVRVMLTRKKIENSSLKSETFCWNMWKKPGILLFWTCSLPLVETLSLPFIGWKFQKPNKTTSSRIPKKKIFRPVVRTFCWRVLRSLFLLSPSCWKHWNKWWTCVWKFCTATEKRLAGEKLASTGSLQASVNIPSTWSSFTRYKIIHQPKSRATRQVSHEKKKNRLGLNRGCNLKKGMLFLEQQKDVESFGNGCWFPQVPEPAKGLAVVFFECLASGSGENERPANTLQLVVLKPWRVA